MARAEDSKNVLGNATAGDICSFTNAAGTPESASLGILLSCGVVLARRRRA